MYSEYLAYKENKECGKNTVTACCFLLTAFCLLLTSFSFASHNRAGHITFQRVSGYTYKIIITTYTDGCGSCADRPTLPISFESCERTDDDDTIERVNGPDVDTDGIPDGEYIKGFEPETIKVNIYTAIHTYPGPNVYVVSVMDPNRNGEVRNMTNSYDTPFYIETPLMLLPGGASNSSPVITIPPVYYACVGQPFIYNPGAVDTVDNDIIGYGTSICYQDCNDTAMGYFIPGNVSVNPVTGDFTWNTPSQEGLYNFAMLIEEWRNGNKISSILLDMQVVVIACDNEPPQITQAGPFCILAGDTLAFDVTATDPDYNGITLTATGAPFWVSPQPAQFDTAFGDSIVTGTFSWITLCSHVQKNPYNVYFKAIDDDTVKLADIKTVQISIVAPSPANFTATPVGNSIHLSWQPESCPQTVKYNIYRSEGGDTASIICPCQTGVPSSSGFTLIGTVYGINSTSFIDDNNGMGLINGILYCYRVTAVLQDGSESCASPAACASLKRDIPIITNVDVAATDNSNGKIELAWAFPVELDTVQIKGPYRYLLYRSPDFYGTNFSLIDSLTGLFDTTYVDSGLNTVANPYSYRIDFYSDAPGNRIRIGFTQKASSVFLTLVSNDNQLKLEWEEHVPWLNQQYEIYKYNPATLLFDSIDVTADTFYFDNGLINKKEYCYYVRSTGTYGTPGIIDPIYNRSQQRCGMPWDFTPPCPPVMSLTSDCYASTVTLTWSNPNYYCADDVVSFNLWRAPHPGDFYKFIAAVTVLTDTVYAYYNPATIAGCYTVTAIDSFGNESVYGNVFCIDNCPVYALPNVFTPDGNGINDRLVPFPYKYIEKINIKIFNRWGQLVFATDDIAVLWDGKNQTTGKDCTPGVYYYLCEVTETRLDGPQSHVLTGFVELLRDSSLPVSK